MYCFEFTKKITEVQQHVYQRKICHNNLNKSIKRCTQAESKRNKHIQIHAITWRSGFASTVASRRLKWTSVCLTTEYVNLLPFARKRDFFVLFAWNLFISSLHEYYSTCITCKHKKIVF